MAEQERQEVDMRGAVDIAFGSLGDLYNPEQLEDVMLEEVLLSGYHRSSVDEEWEVTIGFSRPYNSASPGAVSNVFPQAKLRAYKRFLIDSKTGEVKGMVEGRVDID